MPRETQEVLHLLQPENSLDEKDQDGPTTANLWSQPHPTTCCVHPPTHTHTHTRRHAHILTQTHHCTHIQSPHLRTFRCASMAMPTERGPRANKENVSLIIVIIIIIINVSSKRKS